MSETRTFPTLDVVSATTGVLVSDGGVGVLYEVLGYLLDDSLMTHQLPAASRAATPEVIRQHPWLADLDPPCGDLPALRLWCAAVIKEHGETIDLSPTPEADWRTHNALVDLEDIAGGRPVIMVEVPER